MADVSENDIQRAVFAHFDQRAAPGVFAFHCKNGGVHQAGRRSGINSALGVISGVPDIIAIKDGKVFGLELKTESGRISEAQIQTMQRMQAAGATVALAAGLNAALTKLEEWGLLRGTAA